jgi:hypothetical protein
MKQSNVIYIMFGLLLLIILIIVLFAKSDCKSGYYSEDGKGSIVNPCIKCPSGRDILNTPTYGLVQCGLDAIDDVVDVIDNIIPVEVEDAIGGVIDDIRDRIPSFP